MQKVERKNNNNKSKKDCSGQNEFKIQFMEISFNLVVCFVTERYRGNMHIKLFGLIVGVRQSSYG